MCQWAHNFSFLLDISFERLCKQFELFDRWREKKADETIMHLIKVKSQFLCNRILSTAVIWDSPNMKMIKRVKSSLHNFVGALQSYVEIHRISSFVFFPRFHVSFWLSVKVWALWIWLHCVSRNSRKPSEFASCRHLRIIASNYTRT